MFRQRISQRLRHHKPWIAIFASSSSAGWMFCQIEDEKDSLLVDENGRRQPLTNFSTSTTSSLIRNVPSTLVVPLQLLTSPLTYENRSDCLPFVDSITSWFSKSEDGDDNATLPQRSSSPRSSIRRHQTLTLLDGSATKAPLESKYIWHKDKVLGKGSYGSVYLATSKETGEEVALKQIPKRCTNSVSFQQEMRAMLYIKSKGGHPHLCSLHEHFDSKNDYFVILDYIGGGEMFDSLIENGAYSEMDASRLVREVASSLNFLHGIGVVHADLKPENLLLTTSSRGDSVVKLADFGCAQLLEHADDSLFGEEYEPTYGAPTPAYCPAESIAKTRPIGPAADMWALGVILFIMLTGAHPFDLKGDAPDEVIEERIKNASYKIPFDHRKVTGHLSKSAINLMRQLMHRDPDQRLTALQMLQHPWVRGETATTTKMAGSGDRLSKVRRFKTKIQAKFFEDAIKWSDDDDEAVRRKTSLIERSFQSINTQEMMETVDESGGPKLDMSDFTNLLSDNIKHKHFPTGHIVYKEGEKGHHMYFINAGSVEVATKDGTVATRGQGDFFGEGSLLTPNGVRSATITCQTPVHALEISREYFDKFISKSDSGLLATLKEKDKIRKRNRAKAILALQNGMKPKQIRKGKPFYQDGDADADADSLFILEQGKVDVKIGKHLVFEAYPGNIFGEYSVLTGRPRNCTATCVSKEGCIAQELSGKEFRKLAESSPYIEATLRELQIRREFKKAVVRRLNKQFPYQNPMEAFEAADSKGMGLLDKESVAALMRELHKDYTDEEIQKVLETLDLSSSGKVTFEEFKKIFIGDIRRSASM